MKVQKSELVALFTELDVKGADEWSSKRMLKKLAGLPTLSDEDKERAEGSAELLGKLIEAVEAGEDIEITGGAEEAEEEPAEKPAKKGGKKTAAATEAPAKKKGDKKGKSATADATEADGKADKKKKKAAPAEKKPKEPGVIASIVEFLSEASESKPITKNEVHAKLVKRFPDRSEDSMRSTINIQIPSRLKVDKGITVKKNDKGYWIPGKAAKAKK